MSINPQQTNIVTLSCGASMVLFRLLQAPGWTKITKEKFAAGKLIAQLEELINSVPDQITLQPNEAGYPAAVLAYNKAVRAWDKTSAPGLEIPDLKFQAVQACLKHFTTQESTGSNAYLAELQEAFRITE